MSEVEIHVLEDGEVVERKPLPPDEYAVLVGERREISHIQAHANGTVIVTIKRLGAER
jgi:hypothetical protein